MPLNVDPNKFRFPADIAAGFKGKRVFITGSGKDGGLGQAFALSAGLNGAESVGIHFHSSYDDGLETVNMIREHGGNAFPVQCDVTNPADVWAIRSHVIRKMGGVPNVVICNSGRSETGYLLGRMPKEIEGESGAHRRARVRKAFVKNLTQTRDVVDTKVDGFLAMTHLWASEAVHSGDPITFVYISSRQAFDPGAGVPGYVAANWAVLSLPDILRTNLGKHAGNVTAFSVCYPFVVTGMTEALKDNPRVFGRWQPRMLETEEASEALLRLLARPRADIADKTFQLEVDKAAEGAARDVSIRWSEMAMSVERKPLDWSTF